MIVVLFQQRWDRLFGDRNRANCCVVLVVLCSRSWIVLAEKREAGSEGTGVGAGADKIPWCGQEHFMTILSLSFP